MTATAAEALELALWLHRAPARRAALIGRPLPDGIGQLLRVAGGSPDQVAAAATITGEDEATVLEAVRFYLQQILFQDGADAYRVLGLRPGATQEQAREHHRLLQHWLHPDRRGQDQWESAYTVKVNRAWTQLRTPQSRAAYDATLAATASATAGASPPGGSRPAGELFPKSSSPATAPRPPPSAPNRSRNLTLLVLLACAGLLALIATQNDSPPEWRDDRSVLGQAPAEEGSHVPDGAALVAALDTLAEQAARQVESATVALAESAAPAIMQELPSPPRPVGAGVQAPTNAAQQGPTPLPRNAPAPDVTPPPPAAPVDEEITVAAIESGPAPVAMPATMLTAVAPPRVLAQPIPGALARMHQARQRASEVLRYLGDPDAIQPPVWNDVATAQVAAAVRAALQARHPSGTRLELQDPQWRLSPDGATLKSGYRAAARGRGDETGQIGLQFVWREDRLLVRHLFVTPQ